MPPTKPPESGNDRNEYIPSFIAKAPFYLKGDDNEEDDYLVHQRTAAHKTSSENQWYNRGQRSGPAATKFRKGACENCGSMTHKTKECLYRPRKTGAKWTGRDIQADEIVQKVDLGWDAKRDRWNGYDADEYGAVVEEFNELEEMKYKAKAGGAEGGSGANSGDDGAKYEEETDMGRQQATSTRNLRLREDTAKYLLNLDLDSAKYDPKTRSMVDSGAIADEAASLVAEEGFQKASGDAAEFETLQRYAWETVDRGDKNKLHLQANPTQGEFLRKKEKEESAARKAAQRKALADKYGDQEKLQGDRAKQMAVTESERFVEYDANGGIKGALKTKTTSKYPEDVFINNHTSVWGSWWSDFKWGYKCCHSTVKNSYCTGEQGREAIEQTERLRLAEDFEVDTRPAESNVATDKNENSMDHSKASREKKRTLQEMKDGITEEEMEEYRRKRTAQDDPMARMLSNNAIPTG